MSWRDSHESYTSEPESSQSSPKLSTPASSRRSNISSPMPKVKLRETRGRMAGDFDQDFLNENMLDDLDDGIEDHFPEAHTIGIQSFEALSIETPPTPSIEVPSPSPSSRKISPPRFSAQRGSKATVSNRLVIAIDYGTTYTGVAYATPSSDKAILDDVVVVDDWGTGMGNHPKIPSIYSYSPPSRANEQQWGASLSPDAVTMMNTKMELDVNENKLDELELILQVLEGTSNLNFELLKKAKGGPEYTWKDPEEIVTDYLTKIFQYINQAVEYFGGALRANLPVDIVITVPVRWSYAAKNSTFRAVKKAGFNKQTFPKLADIMILTEPEAAAIYTARYLKEDLSKEFLKVKDCFILCDAGGGTVDVVSYKVTKLVPLELEEMTIPTSLKSPISTRNTKLSLPSMKVQNADLRTLTQTLNGGFKVIGDKYYRVLDPRNIGQQIGVHTSEGKEMRQLMKKFDSHKKAFSNSIRDVMRLDLPAPLDELNIAGRVSGGELKITHEDMKAIFDDCVDNVVQLIQDQRTQVEMKRFRVKNVFLVGGFGESPYLKEELKRSLDLRKIAMRQPEKDNSWTAVVRGAAIYGIEKRHHNNAVLTSTCSTDYAVVLDDPFSSHKNDPKDFTVDPMTRTPIAQKQLTWLVSRGDLILSDEKKVEEREVTFRFRENDERKFLFPIYEYPDDDDDRPERFDIGVNELSEVAVLKIDLSQSKLNEFERRETPETKEPYYTVYLIFKLILCGTSVDAELHWNKKLVSSAKVNDLQTTIG